MIYSMKEFNIVVQSTNTDISSNVKVQPLINIMRTFFYDMRGVRGKKVLDIGPGQCDMLDIFKKAKMETYGIDKEKASIELGTLRGHTMRQVESFKKEWPYAPAHFDGLFCRGSLNYFSGTNTPEVVATLLNNIFNSAKPDAWVWIAPWLRPSESMSDEMVHEYREVAKDTLKKHNITVLTPGEATLNTWGCEYIVPFREIWVRGLPYDTSWL